MPVPSITNELRQRRLPGSRRACEQYMQPCLQVRECPFTIQAKAIREAPHLGRP